MLEARSTFSPLKVLKVRSDMDNDQLTNLEGTVDLGFILPVAVEVEIASVAIASVRWKKFVQNK